MCRIRDHKLGTSFTSVTSIHKPVRKLEKKEKKREKTEYGNGHLFPGFVALLERIESKGVWKTTCKESLSSHDQGTRRACIKQRRVVCIFATFQFCGFAPLFPEHITNTPRHTRVKPKLVPRFAFHHQNGKGQVIIIRKRKQVTMINDEWSEKSLFMYFFFLSLSLS